MGIHCSCKANRLQLGSGMRRLAGPLRQCAAVGLGMIAFWAIAGGTVSGQPSVEPPQGLISWWPGDGHARDIQNGNHGTLVNGATFDAGYVGQAFKFGVNDYVQAPSARLPTGNSDRTLEMWVKVNSFHEYAESYFAGYGNFGSWNETYHLGTVDIEGFGSYLFFSQWGFHIGGPPDLQAGRWYHVAVTNTGNFVTLYQDGTAVNADWFPDSFPINTPGNTQFYIGRIPDPLLGAVRNLDGLVDEVAVYNRALSAAEIKAIYDAGTGGKRKGLAPPAPPLGVSASDGTSTDVVHVTWSASPGAAQYRVFRSAAPYDRGTAVSNWLAATFWDDATAVSATQYWYCVKARNAQGESDYSAPDAGWRGPRPTSVPAWRLYR